jgi:hypothetical protein
MVYPANQEYRAEYGVAPEFRVKEIELNERESFSSQTHITSNKDKRAAAQ